MKAIYSVATVVCAAVGVLLAFAAGWDAGCPLMMFGGVMLALLPWIIAVACGRVRELREAVFPEPPDNDDWN